MAKFFSLLLAISAVVTTAIAGGQLELCTGTSLTGHCTTFSYQDGVCYNLGSDLEDLVKSCDPAGSTHKCYLWQDQNCSGNNFPFTKHHNDLGDFDNLASSFYCVEN